MRALLLIADIGGYTKFMTVHRINLAHAQEVVAQLLEAVIDAAGRKLELAKLEGDAAFFWARLPDAPKEGELEALGQRVLEVRQAFLARRADLDVNRLCTCDGCVQANQLTLKFVAHVGEVALQKVKRFTELAGVDVIFVHRLLKNSVPVREYVLMSEPAFAGLEPELRGKARAAAEELEGLGTVTTHYVDLAQVDAAALAVPRRSGLRALWQWVRMTWRALPYMLGLKKPCEGFKNLDQVR
jgi:hypothetical protein